MTDPEKPVRENAFKVKKKLGHGGLGGSRCNNYLAASAFTVLFFNNLPL
jgi:hypothetical protein